MPLLSTELMFGNVNTISIPTDAIFIISLLIIFALLSYFFSNIINNEEKDLAKRIDDDSNLELVKKKLEDQLTLEVTKLNQKNIEKPSIKKLHLLPPSKLLGLGSLVAVAMGGASLLGLQHFQKSYEGVSTSRVNLKLESPSTKSSFSIVDVTPLDQTKNKLQTNN